MKIQEIHREAIKLSKEATVEFDNENFEQYNILLLKAYELEKSAAEYLENKFDVEPTRSVLYRSAATLAYKSGKYAESIDLITQALRGNPFEEIKEELLHLLKEAISVRPQTIKKNDYLDLLNKKAVSIKLEEKTGKYAGAFVVPHVVEFLRNLNTSYQSYAEALFVNGIDKDSLPDFEHSLNDFKSKSNLLGSHTAFSSFGINISAESSLMEQFNVYTKEFKEIKDNLFNDFKDDVLYPDYEDPIFHQRISNKFDEDQRRKIFNPVLNSLSKSKGYKISITDCEFKQMIKEFKAPNNIIKQALTPMQKKEEMLSDVQTNLTRKIEQSTGKKTKTIFAENIQYLEENITLTGLEFDSKHIYFKDHHVVLLVFQNNYFKIDDETYQISISNSDFDTILESYNKTFIAKLITMISNKAHLSEEEKELLEQYENTTMRDW